MAVVINGTSGITNPNGSAGAPAFTGQGSDTGLYFPTNTSVGLATGGVGRILADANGYVTTPSQPAFCVWGNSFSGVDFLGTGVVVNTGTNFNVSNGSFTAPVAGRYLLNFSMTTEDTNSHFIEIAVNGTNVALRQLSYGVVYQPGTQFVIVQMAAGDYANARKRDPSYAVYNAVFSGYLIG